MPVGVVWAHLLGKQKLWMSDISLNNSINFFTHKTAEFLDTSCHRFVSTNLDFAPSKSGKMSTIGKKTNITWSRSYSMAVSKRQWAGNSLKLPALSPYSALSSFGKPKVLDLEL
jgi:hypothetical protein